MNPNIVKQLFILIILWLTPCLSRADAMGYSEKLTLKAVSRHYIVIHFHDWSRATTDARYKMIGSRAQDPFTKENNYAYIKCIDRATGKLIFKKPCAALTNIRISADEKYIVGISNVMLWNPYQLVVFSTKGALVKKRHISSEEAKLTKEQLAEFKKQFPASYSFLDSFNKILTIGDTCYVDCVSMGMPDVLGLQAWHYLLLHSGPNHLSGNFSESVTNWVFWFYEDDPEIRFEYDKTGLYAISLLDPEKKRFKISIRE